MAIKRSRAPTGTVVILEHQSRVLRDNPWGDRTCASWQCGCRRNTIKPRGRPHSGERVDSPCCRHGWLHRSGLSPSGGRRFRTTCPRACAAYVRRQMGPESSSCPIASRAGGNHTSIRPLSDGCRLSAQRNCAFVDREFARSLRVSTAVVSAVIGRYGAIVHGIKYASTGRRGGPLGDSYFDFVYWHDWPNTLNELGKHRAKKRSAGRCDAAKEASSGELDQGIDDGRVKRFLKHVWSKQKVSSAETHCIMNLCMAATYDPDPEVALGFRLPCNLETGERIEKRWQRWLAHDPINPVQRHASNLKYWRYTSIAAGATSSNTLARASCRGVMRRRHRAPVQEFDDDHSDVDYRMDVSLPFLYRALKP